LGVAAVGAGGGLAYENMRTTLLAMMSLKMRMIFQPRSNLQTSLKLESLRTRSTMTTIPKKTRLSKMALPKKWGW